MIPPLDPRRLETFRVVVGAGRISEAARLLHLSQPAVTAQIRQLEASCGRPLLLRSARGVTPTEAGQVLLGHARRLHALLDEAGAALAQPEHAGEELVLAASTTIAAYVVPRLLASFLAQEGARPVRLEVGNTSQVAGWVAEGQVPLGLVEGHSRVPRLSLERFLDDELVPVIATGSSLAPIQRAGDLSRVPVLFREPGSGTRAVIERALRKAGRTRAHPADLQLGSTEAIRAAAALGLGLAFLSRWSITAELAEGRLRVLRIPDLRLVRRFSWALPASALPGVAGRFLRFARAHPPRPPSG